MPILTTLGAACARAWGFTSGLLKDPYFNLTTLLLPGNGTNGAQNNTFLDSSTNNFTITRNGNTTQGTFSPFSQTGWGNYFGGSADWLTTSSSVTALGAGNWTVEFWLYPTTSGTTRIISDARTSSQGLYPLFGLSTANAAIFYVNTTFVLSSTNTVSANTWTHVAFVKNSATTTCYINGVASGSFSDSNTYLANPITFGASGLTGDSHGSKFTGYISNYRQVVGRAVYTSDFTPPTSPLGQTSGGQNPPTGTQTSLLTCQSNRFVDNSSSPYTITPSGSPSVVAFSPFAPTAAYTTAAVGGSGYFDGSGDYLTATNNAAYDFGTGNFTVETWAYITSYTGGSTDVIISNYQNSTNGWTLGIYNATGKFYFAIAGDSGQIDDTAALPLNQWVHLVAVRSSTTMSLFVNGTRAATTTNSTNNTSTSVLTIGTNVGGGVLNFNGYLSNTRIVKGTAVYDPTLTMLTVPTAPLTAITNTSLLLNFTNAGITDATAKNDLETVGNAQISTSVSKFGGGSIAFDGTSDYLYRPDTALNQLGTGDYTIELWLYPNSFSNTPVLLEYGRQAAGSTPGLELFVATTSGRLDVYGGSATNTLLFSTTSTNIATGTWTHIALTRASGTTRLYFNGTQPTGSSVSDTTNYTQANIWIGAYIGGTASLNGYIDDFRITKGLARYTTTSFTPPSAPFPVQ